MALTHWKTLFIGPVQKALYQAPTAPLPPPWRLVAHRAVGGLTEVGFVRDTAHLVIISTNGQGVLDCVTGDMIHRDRTQDGFDARSNRARNLADPDGPLVDMAGLSGGGLMNVTPDGWTARMFPLDWPRVHCILEPPGASIDFVHPKWRGHDKDARFYVVRHDYEPRVFGFSYSGQNLVWADSSDLIVWSRADAGGVEPHPTV